MAFCDNFTSSFKQFLSANIKNRALKVEDRTERYHDTF